MFPFTFKQFGYFSDSPGPLLAIWRMHFTFPITVHGAAICKSGIKLQGKTAGKREKNGRFSQVVQHVQSGFKMNIKCPSSMAIIWVRNELFTHADYEFINLVLNPISHEHRKLSDNTQTTGSTRCVSKWKISLPFFFRLAFRACELSIGSFPIFSLWQSPPHIFQGHRCAIM